ncbi:MAG: polyprenyl synthetase family protein [Woeseia sp.]
MGAIVTSSFAERIEQYTDRIGRRLDEILPPADQAPERLHAAMRYSVLNGGKRIRPLLAYASAECLQIRPAMVDATATAIELMHAFSLVHDDLPAMDDDDLRRGKPTVHRKFDEATAILAADALQPLAFAAIADCPKLTPVQIVRLSRLVASACGSLGMTGGQSIDLSSEGKALTVAELEHMYRLKTGALIHASILSAACVAPDISADERNGLEIFAESIGLAFQIRDDILDIDGETHVIGKPAGSDERSNKATFPALFGMEAARARCKELLQGGLASLDVFGDHADPLRWIAHYIVDRQQ